MDAFAELGLVPTFELSKTELEGRYLMLLTELHPDRFVNRMPAEQTLAETKSAAINQAYHLLKKPASRARCLLENRGIDCTSAESKSPETAQVLFEIMEFREQLTALETAEDRTRFDAEAQKRLEEACTLFAKALEQDATHIIPAYLRLTYLDKIVDEAKRVRINTSIQRF